MTSEDIEVISIVRELSGTPGVSAVWTEIDPFGHRIWMAQGANGHPWLLASDHLDRFRVMISDLSDGNEADG